MAPTKLIGVVLCVTGGMVAAQRDDAEVEIKTTHVAGPVHMLEGRGGNIGVSAGPDGILIVDDQFAPLAGKIRAALGKLATGKLKVVLNTHWHGDHTGGNVAFGTEAPIIAHTNVRRRLSSPQKLFGRVVEPLPEDALPVITFDDSVSVHFNGEEIRVFHLPHGHTDGDSVVLFAESNVVHMGDLFFAGSFPFVDLENGGNVQGMADNVAKVMAELSPDIKVIPGHGPLSGLDDLKEYHRMLVETTKDVRVRRAAGQSLEQIQSEGLSKAWSNWGSGFIDEKRWIELVYQSLGATR